MNIQQTNGRSVTKSLPVSQTVRELTALRNKHGTNSPIGYRCSNIMELLDAFSNGDRA